MVVTQNMIWGRADLRMSYNTKTITRSSTEGGKKYWNFYGRKWVFKTAWVHNKQYVCDSHHWRNGNKYCNVDRGRHMNITREQQTDTKLRVRLLPFAPRSTNPNPSLSFFCRTTVFSSITQSLWRKFRAKRPLLLHPIIRIIATAARPECFIMTARRLHTELINYGNEWCSLCRCDSDSAPSQCSSKD